jgi:hypothetical protein
MVHLLCMSSDEPQCVRGVCQDEMVDRRLRRFADMSLPWPVCCSVCRQWVSKNIPLLLDKNPNVRQMAGSALATVSRMDPHTVSSCGALACELLCFCKVSKSLQDAQPRWLMVGDLLNLLLCFACHRCWHACSTRPPRRLRWCSAAWQRRRHARQLRRAQRQLQRRQLQQRRRGTRGHMLPMVRPSVSAAQQTCRRQGPQLSSTIMGLTSTSATCSSRGTLSPQAMLHSKHTP